MTGCFLRRVCWRLFINSKACLEISASLTKSRLIIPPILCPIKTASWAAASLGLSEPNACFNKA